MPSQRIVRLTLKRRRSRLTGVGECALSPAEDKSMTQPSNETGTTREAFVCGMEGGFADWLASAGLAVAITTYQAGKIALAGSDGGRPTVLFRDVDKPMGLAVKDNRLALATRRDIVLFSNDPVLAREYSESQPSRYDALFLPRSIHRTGELNVHDIAWGGRRLWMVNTRFSCLATLSASDSFVPRWKPDFITDIVPEDRCHLNGLAMKEGKPAFVTLLGESDTPGGWREHKRAGGLILDVRSGAVVARGLSMPHSPRWHQGALWALNSGEGELLRFDLDRGRPEVVCSLPGYLRGLAFVGDYALVGLSQVREKHLFGGLTVQERFSRLRCGVALVDCVKGQSVGFFSFDAGCHELYDVQVLAGMRQPMIVHEGMEQSWQAISTPEFSYWLRPSHLVADYSSDNSD